MTYLLSKIKLDDCDELHSQIVQCYASCDALRLAKWALLIAKRTMRFSSFLPSEETQIEKAMAINVLWQKGEATVAEIRKAALEIHALARDQEDALARTILRVIGHAVASGHMQEHAMIASDYAIKVTNLIYPADMEKVRAERLWQLYLLKECSLHLYQ